MLSRFSPRLTTPSTSTPRGVRLGRRIAGERALPLVGADVVLPFELLHRHMVVVGKSGSGKTETVLRIAHDVAADACLDAPVFYLDAKGDRENARRFAGLMEQAGRSTRVFPHQRFDAWRGDAKAIVNRLLGVISFTEQGPAAYYRDIAKMALQLACHHPDGPPRSSGEFLHRLDMDRLARAHSHSSALASLSGELLQQVRMRYEAFFGQVGSLLDGEWSWEDADAAYLLLDSMALGEEAASVAAIVFADFAHYFTMRKPRDRHCLMVVDEFSSLAQRTDMAVKVEQARAFNAGLVLVPQVISGMGGDEQRDRILGSVETVIVHALNAPEQVTALAGMKPVPEVSYSLEEDEQAVARRRHVRRTLRPRLDPERVRAQEPGQAWVIRRGRVGQVAIHRAPRIQAELPEAEPAERAPPPAPGEPKHLDIYEEES